jgi:hypothetical protein
VDIAENNAGHGYPKQQREAMVNWMRRWLLGKDDHVTEPDFTTYKTAELQVTRTGQVLEDFKGKSVVDLNVEREKELADKRTKEWEAMTKDQQRVAVRKVLALPEKVPAAKRTVVGEIKREKIVIEKVIYETEPGILVPAIEYRPATKKRVTASICVSDLGKESCAETVPGGVEAQVIKEQGAYIFLDVRGCGETAPGKRVPGKPGYFGVDSTESFLAMHLNRPLLGQRTYDLLAVCAALRDRGDSLVTIAGDGQAAPVALHAAFLTSDPIEGVGLFDLLLSWSSVAKSPVSANQLTGVVPGVLAVYDLPDLAKAMKKALPLVFVVSAVDAKGEAVSDAERERVYPLLSQLGTGLPGWIFKKAGKQ